VERGRSLETRKRGMKALVLTGMLKTTVTNFTTGIHFDHAWNILEVQHLKSP